MPETLIRPDHLRKFVNACFLKAGLPAEDAAFGTDVLIWASLRGVDTHGVRNLKRYYVDSAGGVGRRDGVIVTDAKLSVDKDAESTAALNANGGLGLSVSVRAMQMAIDKAANRGVGMVTVRNSTHFGAAGYYAHMAAQHDMLGFASTGYLFPHGQEKAVVPFGGLIPMLSTNPLAMACPSASYPPFVLDMSTSTVPVNRIEMLQDLGRAFPKTWALDENHEETDDPAQVKKMIPLGGATQYGGHKGYGLALAGWILTGLLSGAWRTDPLPERVLGETPETKHGHAQEGIGHAFAAIRLDAFGDPGKIKVGLDAMIRTMNENPSAEGFEQVFVPGQIEHETEQQREREGIPVSEMTMSEFRSLADQYGLELPT